MPLNKKPLSRINYNTPGREFLWLKAGYWKKNTSMDEALAGGLEIIFREFSLSRRAVLICVGAVYAAVPRFWFQDCATTGALIKGHSKIVRHFFLFGETAFRAGDLRWIFDHFILHASHYRIFINDNQPAFPGQDEMQASFTYNSSKSGFSPAGGMVWNCQYVFSSLIIYYTNSRVRNNLNLLNPSRQYILNYSCQRGNRRGHLEHHKVNCNSAGRELGRCSLE